MASGSGKIEISSTSFEYDTLPWRNSRRIALSMADNTAGLIELQDKAYSIS